MRWVDIGVAAALVHQDYPISICDLDIVGWAGGRITTSVNRKVSELQFQYLPTLHFYSLCLVKVFRILGREVWRGDNTCGK